MAVLWRFDIVAESVGLSACDRIGIARAGSRRARGNPALARMAASSRAATGGPALAKSSLRRPVDHAPPAGRALTIIDAARRVTRAAHRSVIASPKVLLIGLVR